MPAPPGPEPQDSDPSSAEHLFLQGGHDASSEFGSSFDLSSNSDTLDEPESTGSGTQNVPSEILREQSEGDDSHLGGAGPPASESLSDPHASSAKQSALVGTAKSKLRFRPHLRPPTPVLEVLDDDLEGSEKVRIRLRNFTIGRVQGDLILPNDRVMSRRHAEIVRDAPDTSGVTRWRLRDLASVNGTFVRKLEIELTDRDRLWLGGDLVRVSLNAASGQLTIAELKQGDVERVTFEPGKHWIGTDLTRCADFLSKSPFLDPCAFCVEGDPSGRRWRLLDAGSENGLWRAIEDQPAELTDAAEFKLGEQHFRFRLP